MFPTSSALPEAARAELVGALGASVLDGIDLYPQLKVAHWNVRGGHFLPLHELFDAIAGRVLGHVDDLAERAVTLGGRAPGTARQVARGSRLTESPAVAEELALVAIVAERADPFTRGLRAARALADQLGDVDTEDLLTGMIRGLDKDGWFLRAHLG